MNKVLLQVWEESNKNEGIRQDGCSLHLNNKYRESYINTIYQDRKVDNVPDSYERIVGEPSWVEVSNDIYNKLLENKSIRLMRWELNNLLNMEEIIV